MNGKHKWRMLEAVRPLQSLMDIGRRGYHPADSPVHWPDFLNFRGGKQGYLLMKLNEGLKVIMEDGTYDKIIEKWGVL
jgi:hypothetical protein